MIETLRIANLAIVESVELEFGTGLNVLTGETGAGKSLVLSALALLAGARARADSVREGADEARVEAVFRTDDLPELEAILTERGLEGADHELVVTRTVNRNGRSRATVSGQLVPVATLAELFAGRLEISSQHESQRLRRPEHHARMLDAFGGLSDARAAVTDGYESLREARAECQRLSAEAGERERRRDFLAFQLEEIDRVELQPGEIDTLDAEHRRLSNAETLRGHASEAAAQLAGDPNASDALGAADRLEAAAHQLGEVESLDPALGALAERLRNASAELADVAADLERYADGVEGDTGRLAEVEDRIAQLERLRRKYGPAENEIFALRQQLAAELSEVEGGDARLETLAAREADLARALTVAASALSRGRKKAAKRLATEVERHLEALDLPGASLAVALEPAAPPEGLPVGPGGAETVELQLAANRGERPLPLHRIASGGELSRIFLALKNALRRSERGMVLVFDEVDAGIGGRAAARVGEVLNELAGHHQLVCITHWPQIAASATTHLRVAKGAQDGRTRSRIRALEGAERVEELARMAGGESVTDATRAHARELLGRRPRGRRAPGRTSPPPR